MSTLPIVRVSNAGSYATPVAPQALLPGVTVAIRLNLPKTKIEAFFQARILANAGGWIECKVEAIMCTPSTTWKAEAAGTRGVVKDYVFRVRAAACHHIPTDQQKG